MTIEEFEIAYDHYDLDDEYQEFIMENLDEERPICEGEDLIKALEEEFLFQEFKEYMTGRK